MFIITTFRYNSMCDALNIVYTFAYLKKNFIHHIKKYILLEKGLHFTHRNIYLHSHCYEHCQYLCWLRYQNKILIKLDSMPFILTWLLYCTLCTWLFLILKLISIIFHLVLKWWSLMSYVLMLILLRFLIPNEFAWGRTLTSEAEVFFSMKE